MEPAARLVALAVDWEGSPIGQPFLEPLVEAHSKACACLSICMLALEAADRMNYKQGNFVSRGFNVEIINGRNNTAMGDGKKE